jgi:phage-related protein
MGMFDNLFQSLDNVLKEVESGELEKKLDNLAGMIDKTSQKVVDTTEKFADKPAELLNKFDEKAEIIKTQTTKTMDVFRQKDNG